MVLKRAVILKHYYMTNGLTSLIHKKNLPNFQGCWGKVKKLSLKKILLKNFKERPSKLEKGYSQVLVKQTVLCSVVVIVHFCNTNTRGLGLDLFNHL